jgi:hypothetical protein
MNRYLPLSDHLRKQLAYVEPTLVHGVPYYPCAVYTTTGQLLPCVYIVEENAYFQQWGVWPEDDRAKRSIPLHEVSSIAEAPNRLPLRYAHHLHTAGETGMGYHAFKLLFRDGTTQSYTAGNALDFVNFPEGLGREDIIQVIPNFETDVGKPLPPASLLLVSLL